jgi:hypothetical protein
MGKKQKKAIKKQNQIVPFLMSPEGLPVLQLLDVEDIARLSLTSKGLLFVREFNLSINQILSFLNTTTMSWWSWSLTSKKLRLYTAIEVCDLFEL